jgi:hypothetical protein
MQSSEKERLLRDILAEGGYADFKNDLYGKTAAEFRRTHGRRVSFLPWALAASLAMSGYAWYFFMGRTGPQRTIQAHSVEQTSEPAWVVQTPRSLAEELLVRSSTAERVTVKSEPSRVTSVNSSRGNLAVVSSMKTDPLVVSTDLHWSPPLITDKELLGLFPDQPVGFVQGKDGHREFLVLVEPPPEK